MRSEPGRVVTEPALWDWDAPTPPSPTAAIVTPRANTLVARIRYFYFGKSAAGRPGISFRAFSKYSFRRTGSGKAKPYSFQNA